MAYDVYGNVKVLYNPSGDSSQWHIACSTGTEGLDYGDYSICGNPYYFTGRRLDNETGLYYYRARYYNPNIGRFMQTDPIGYSDGLNWYAYCGNNPVMFFDPMGLCGDGLDFGGSRMKPWWDPTGYADAAGEAIDAASRWTFTGDPYATDDVYQSAYYAAGAELADTTVVVSGSIAYGVIEGREHGIELLIGFNGVDVFTYSGESITTPNVGGALQFGVVKDYDHFNPGVYEGDFWEVQGGGSGDGYVGYSYAEFGWKEGDPYGWKSGPTLGWGSQVGISYTRSNYTHRRGMDW